MRMSLGLPTHRVGPDDDLATPDALADVAVAAERAGFDAVYVTDHPFPPDAWLGTGGHHTLDPLVALAFAAAATSTLRLQTNLFVPAYRNPFAAAKAVATLDVLSGGRVVLGVGAGYLEEEFAALGADFARRNDVLDEALVAMKAAWSGTTVVHRGPRFDARGNTMLPRPVQRPHPPIWVGGNSRRAVRRAVEHGDGWVPMRAAPRIAAHVRTAPLASPGELRDRLAYAREHASAVGRTAPLEVVFTPTGLDMLSKVPPHAEEVLEELGELTDAGVTYATVHLPARSRAELLDRIAEFGSAVVRPAARL